jgi:hypothetical protein
MLQWTKKAPGHWIAQRSYSAGYAALVVVSRNFIEQSGAQWPASDNDVYLGGGEIMLSETRSGLVSRAAVMCEAFYTVFAAQRDAEQWAEESEELFIDARPIILFDAPVKQAQRFVGLLRHDQGFRLINGNSIGMISRIGNFLALVANGGLTYYTFPDELGLPANYNPGEIEDVSVEFSDHLGGYEDDEIPF